jgi:hypothetical protein
MKKGSGKWAGAVCCVCGGKFSASYAGNPYCNKHWQRMYHRGTIELKERKSTNQFILQGETVHIITANGNIIYADAIDYELISKYSWCISKTGYAVANINGKVIKMHRFILNAEKSQIIDHINGNQLDNRRSNLRICTSKGNARNCSVSKNNQTGAVGVSRKKNGKYRARIMVDRKEICLGTYDNIEDAINVRKNAEILYFGEFAPCVSRE